MKHMTFMKLMRDCDIISNKKFGYIKENAISIIISSELGLNKNSHINFH